MVSFECLYFTLKNNALEKNSRKRGKGNHMGSTEGPYAPRAVTSTKLNFLINHSYDVLIRSSFHSLLKKDKIIIKKATR